MAISRPVLCWLLIASVAVCIFFLYRADSRRAEMIKRTKAETGRPPAIEASLRPIALWLALSAICTVLTLYTLIQGP